MKLRVPVVGILAIKILFLSSISIDAVAATLLYANNFDQGSVGLESGDENWFPKSSKNPPDASIVRDPAGGSGSVMRIYMDGSSAGRNLEDDGVVYKHRALMSFGHNINNAPGRGDGIRFAAGKEYWFGFRYFVPSGVAAANRGQMVFTFSPMSASVGESTMLLGGNNRLIVYPERYKDEKGSLVENKNKEMIAPIKNDAWNDIIVRWVRNPYWLGQKLGQPPTGRFSVWVNGVEYDSGPVYAGTDREARGEFDPVARYGVYFVEDRPGSYYEFLFDNIRIAEGADGKSLVDPSLSASVGQSIPPASPELKVN